MRQLFILPFVLLCLMSAGFSAAADKAYDQPIVTGPFVKKPLAAIFSGMSDHGWVAKDQKPGQVTALLDYKSRQIIVNINYDKSQISFSPVSDRRLDCSGPADQCRVESSYYDRWRSNLRASIQKAANTQAKQGMSEAAHSH